MSPNSLPKCAARSSPKQPALACLSMAAQSESFERAKFCDETIAAQAAIGRDGLLRQPWQICAPTIEFLRIASATKRRTAFRTRLHTAKAFFPPRSSNSSNPCAHATSVPDGRIETNRSLPIFSSQRFCQRRWPRRGNSPTRGRELILYSHKVPGALLRKRASRHARCEAKTRVGFARNFKKPRKIFTFSLAPLFHGRFTNARRQNFRLPTH